MSTLPSLPYLAVAEELRRHHELDRSVGMLVCDEFNRGIVDDTRAYQIG